MVARLVRDQKVVGSSPFASTTEKALKLKGFKAFFFPKTAVKIRLDHMFDHLRIFLCFYVLGIAVFSRKIKNPFLCLLRIKF